jgi:hypothetical protein
MIELTCIRVYWQQNVSYTPLCDRCFGAWTLESIATLNHVAVLMCVKLANYTANIARSKYSFEFSCAC